MGAPGGVVRWAGALVLCALTGSSGGAQPAAACKLTEIGSATVRAAIDGHTLALTDGVEVRLIGIELDPATGKLALQELAGGREITLKRLGAERDRYGRVPAFAFLSGEAESIQHALLLAGRARVAARVGDRACALPLLSAERTARAARRGLWSDAGHAPQKASDVAGLLALRGRFALVEGRLLSVRESGGTLYLNFGRRWSTDFTATMSRRSEKSFIAEGLDVRKLAGLTVRVRGYIEERSGPWIDVTRPEQIEIARPE